MGYYKVKFDDYCLSHCDKFKHLNYFEFNGKKYPIGAYVNLTKDGEYYMLYNRGYNFIRGNFRLVDHFVTDTGVEKWEYIIGRLHDSNIPILKYTTKSPDELIQEVKCAEINENVYTLGELKVEFKEPNYFPKDSEVDNVIIGWVVFTAIWFFAFLLKDLWIRLIIQVVAGLYFGNWREKQINKAISEQKFKK